MTKVPGAEPIGRARARTSGAVLVGGGLAYAALVGQVGLTFDATPAVIGATVVLAGLVGGQRRLVPIGVTLMGWGAAVLLVRHGPVPDEREAPALVLGIAIGLLGAHRLTRRWSIELTGSLLTAINAGLAFYVAYDLEAVNDWPFWTAAMIGWGFVEGALLGQRKPAKDRRESPNPTATDGTWKYLRAGSLTLRRTHQHGRRARMK